jgi:hypothetical protein
MFNIEKYLEKFSKNIHSSSLQKECVLRVIKKYTQIQLSPDEIEVKNYIVYIKTSPAVLNKIFIYKSKILEDIALQTPSLKIVDTR